MKTTRWMLGGWLVTLAGLTQSGSLPGRGVVTLTSRPDLRWVSLRIAAFDLLVPRLQDVAAPPATTRLAPAVAAEATKPTALVVTTNASRWVAVSAIAAVLMAIALAARRRVLFGNRS